MNDDGRMMQMGWGKFAAMIAVSVVFMFALAYQLVYSADHLFFSINRLLSALVMGCLMAAIMLAFMWKMYEGPAAKLVVLIFAVVAGLGLLYVNRTQALIGDEAFMRAMIPHHSIAINNARKAEISDPRVRRLADGIIESQVREIEEMKRLLNDIEANGERGGAPIPPRTAKVTPDMEPEIEKALQ